MGTRDVGPANLITHVLLIHNFTPYVYSINSPFWSLALEWQWYWIFPVVLIAAIRFPVLTASTSLILACLWQAAMENSPIVASWLPGRLFEFCCGVLVARLVVRGVKAPSSLLLFGAIAAVALAEAPFGTFVGDTGIYQPLYGIAFALLLLLASTSFRVQAILSWQPLVRLGVISYSVYLVHRPVSDIIESFAPYWLRSSEALIPVAAVAGLSAGIIFHIVIERPCMSQATWRRVGPALQRWLAWTDRVFRVKRSLVALPEDRSAPMAPTRASA